MWRSRPVSRILCGARFARAAATISLGAHAPRRCSPAPCGLPGSIGRATLERSLLGLAPGGACRAGAVARAAGELLPHRFTLTARAIGALRRFPFCCAFARSPPPGSPQHPALWSPDFPRAPEGTRGRPAGSSDPRIPLSVCSVPPKRAHLLVLSLTALLLSGAPLRGCLRSWVHRLGVQNYELQGRLSGDAGEIQIGPAIRSTSRACPARADPPPGRRPRVGRLLGRADR